MLRKRTDQDMPHVSRWANLLLQRIETYEGVLIAATNKVRGLTTDRLCVQTRRPDTPNCVAGWQSDHVDEAYRRRFKFWVRFPAYKPGWQALVRM
jgi:hypothetical protein